jgi:serine phosphatase RsbU (regulator of sigma subunit)
MSYDPKNRTLIYSGAFNPMYLIRDNKIIELKGDRMPLAHYARMTGFSSHEIITRPNDVIYLFTDGYIDQFGGPEAKKFRPAHFKEVLIKYHKEPFELQKQLLLDCHLNWKGTEDQVDDITIIGLKL